MKRTIAPAATALLALTAVLALAGCAGTSSAQAATRWNAPASPDVNDNATVEPSPESVSPSPSPSRSPSAKPSTSRKPSPTPKKSTPVNNTLVVYGTTFIIAPGGTGVFGSGARHLRYEVAVQSGLSESLSSVAASVDAILDNQSRGWLRSGTWTFQRVSSGAYDFVVELATASTTDMICGKYGISTGGVVNCRALKNVVINLTRWEQGTNGTTMGATAYDPATYRILAVNHEVGHALGYNHMGCSAAGALAPVMMTQYYGLNGCVPNVWPYDASGTFVRGPAAS